ncbi:hypothetical protein [Aquitalea magnusonii]|uniref:hypothetical protein n=1 Tax=Aquitalea magnusonii TaxID=332411 RepID=UPI0011B51538|nr:hypothetical protein [Aquitalea magnusonii]
MATRHAPAAPRRLWLLPAVAGDAFAMIRPLPGQAFALHQALLIFQGTTMLCRDKTTICLKNKRPAMLADRLVVVDAEPSAAGRG